MLPYRDSRIVRIFLIIFFVLAALYAAYEAQGMLYGPTISVPERAVTVHEAHTAIRGHAERISELHLNGTVIAVTEEGEFNEPYLLAPGSNRVVLEARDARGRTTTKTLDIIYTPDPGETPYAPAPSPTAPTTTATTSAAR